MEVFVILKAECGSMTINFKTGNIFSSDARALVNTVNCEGIMGKGLAYQFKEKFPLMEKDYKITCKRQELIPGKLHFFRENGKIIINFPTKNKWRETTKIEYIESGLRELRSELIKQEISSVAIPPLGSGNGGMDWNKVKIKIIGELDDISEKISIEVYEPSKKVDSAKKVPNVNYNTLFLIRVGSQLNNFDFFKLKIAVNLAIILSNKRIKINNLKEEVRNIRQLKLYYNLHDYDKLIALVQSKIVSRKTEKQGERDSRLIDVVCCITNNYDEETLKGMVIELRKIEDKCICTYNYEIINILLKEGLVFKNLLNENEINYL